ncbi:thioredoxin-like domain-containing protein, partial [uncultured Porphyromonas sp.]|uniref:TlpA family protein disulfide reductase n=1 Tax=uncultured Porphyromonas sp. TaxID=159274 RepID=UPI002629F395
GASWCTPCRVSIISLREIYKTHGDSIRFISISLDQQEADWQKALKEEKLPWAQFRSLPEQTKTFTEQYNLIGIPAFFIIDSEGESLAESKEPVETLLSACISRSDLEAKRQTFPVLEDLDPYQLLQI